jgi:double-stranded uracil-DNA glycosylase
VTTQRAFPPVANADAETLILGSMPSVASLKEQQYYANPRNAFWRICGELLGFDPELPYADRCEVLRAKRIAVWDVYAACERPGSLDSAIVTETAEVNDFNEFMEGHWAISTVCCNGATAHRVFTAHVLPGLLRRFEVHKLPSTSPANARTRFDAKLAAWREALL